ncbi:ferritin-like domain-containing protein [Brevibacillus laterosporus]|uniref:ferritin-like domain-containing protein n=1 Tax=Brevibacillus laterosporus TaxID=1465 RepID=UPI0018F8B4F0|nr:ferritin-like domain-containing protein [Brevibacillus laterosporus]MBG9775361.1 hypothetical protein [Brevibacillus laterosporus]MCR8937523.1 ferritin-like domain-containing protein [Brevibacillus laterosporus]MCZ0840162.1 ferritin-like domain-containing protein [Brevibacillus laterosporus]MCZ0843958.1 ferritin-like domain-containing protein [Brevibacillus laterosporus]
MQTISSTLANAQNQQLPFPTPPTIITGKDLSYLKDAMSWELNAFKKLHFFAQQVQDPQIKDLLNKTGYMHQMHYEQLLTHLTINNTAVTGSLPQMQ